MGLWHRAQADSWGLTAQLRLESAATVVVVQAAFRIPSTVLGIISMQFSCAIAELSELRWEDCYDCCTGGGGKEKLLKGSKSFLVKYDPHSSLLVGV